MIDHGRMVTEGAPRDLIATHIEPHVVEVFGDEAGSWARARSHLGERLEVAGETAFYYCHDTAPLIAALADEPACVICIRAASLEDVFIKLTGRELGIDHEHTEPLRNSPPRPALVARLAAQLLVWRKLAIPSVLGNLADPLIYMLGLGYGLGGMLPQMNGVSYVAFLAAGTVVASTMNAATFEALYSSFSRMHVQKTWDAILNTPLSLDHVLAGELCLGGEQKPALRTGHPGRHLRPWADDLTTCAVGDPGHLLTGGPSPRLRPDPSALAPSYDFFMYHFRFSSRRCADAAVAGVLSRPTSCPPSCMPWRRGLPLA